MKRQHWIVERMKYSAIVWAVLLAIYVVYKLVTGAWL